MPKKELTPKEALDEAVTEMRQALIQNVEASGLVIDSQKKKEAARHRLLKAKELLHALTQQYM